MYYSQIGQDEFVLEALEYKQNGTFLDIGCHHFEHISNTYYLEKQLNWTGIGVDVSCEYEADWLLHRKNSKFVCADAVTLDYKSLFEKYNMPKIIDYVSLDLEPPQLTFKALQKLFETDYTFRVVTFETDEYRQTETLQPSRLLFEKLGYVRITTINKQDDFYINPSLLIG